MFWRVSALFVLLVVVYFLFFTADPAVGNRAIPSSYIGAVSPATTPTATSQPEQVAKMGRSVKHSDLAAAVADGSLGAAFSPMAGETPITTTVFLPIVAKAPPPTATPMPTPVPGPVVTINDDFSDSNSGWPINDLGQVSFSYLNGEYRIRLLQTNYVGGSFPDPYIPMSDFHVGVDVRVPVGDSSNFIGLAYGIDSDWYALTACLVGNGTVGFSNKMGSQWWPPFPSSPWTIDWADRTSHRLELVRSGSSVECYVDGSLVTSATRSYWLGLGEVGLVVRSLTEWAPDARFDNYNFTGTSVVWTPTPTP